MPQQAGRADITVNGVLVDTFDGVTLKTGGIMRTQNRTSRRGGWTEKTVGSALDIEKAINKGSSIAALDVADGVIQVKFDTGQTYVMPGATRQDPEELADTGKSKISFFGDPCKEIL